MGRKPDSLTSRRMLLQGFRIATFAEPGAVLGRTPEGEALFVQPERPCGEVENAVLSLAGDRIEWVLPQSLAQRLIGDQNSGPEAASCLEQAEVVEGHGAWLTPGLIDCHTHLVYGGNRANEWSARLAGKSYAEIAREGGGIWSTVEQTRRATEVELVESAVRRGRRLVAEGVTTLEIKSGYGLNLETELRMLRVARQLADLLDVSVEPTLLAAHALPREYAGRSDDYIDFVCKEMIPAAAGHCTAVDVFCESIAFNVEQSLRVFASAKRAGLRFKVHAEQLSRTGIAAEAARRGALSVDHVEYLNADDCRVLGECGTTAVLLPGAWYCLKDDQKPPVPELLRCGVRLAVSTDSNPGSSPLVSILLAGNMACNLFGLTPEQSLTGMTRHAASALGLIRETGTLEPGKRADLAIWNVNDPAEILYGLGHNPCLRSMRQGRWRQVSGEGCT